MFVTCTDALTLLIVGSGAVGWTEGRSWEAIKTGGISTGGTKEEIWRNGGVHQ